MQLTRRIASIGLALVVTVAAGCSSDDDSDGAATTVATTVTTPVDTGATTSTVAGAAGEDDTFADRSVIVNYLLSAASASGQAVDSQCVLDLVAQLSDADAKVLADSFRTGTPPEVGGLSDEGEALGNELPGCATTATT